MAIATFFQNPLLGNKVPRRSQEYNVDDPDTATIEFHLGIDLVTEGPSENRIGDPIRAAANGKVVYAGFAHSTLGNVVIIQHQLADGVDVTSIYFHLDEIYISSGDVVAGEVIGSMGTAVGASGKTFPPHLHFAMRLGEYSTTTSVTDWTGFGYSAIQDGDPFSSGFINPSWFLENHLNPLSINHIFGTDGHDSDTLAPGRTAIYGSGLNDGSGPNDKIETMAGDDLAFGREGDDTIDAGTGLDTIFGGANGDIVVAYAIGADSLDGGDGVDGLWLDRSDLAVGQNINLRSSKPILLTDGTTFKSFEWYDLQTGSGDDRITISGAATEQHISANGGRDRAVLDFASATDSVNFKRLRDVALSDTVIYEGKARAQAIQMSGFEDFTIYGGVGNDKLDAQYMISSNLYGNAGNDRLFGTNSTDFLYGGDGNDRIEGFNCHINPDRIFGGAGNDTLTSTGDGSVLTGGEGDDVMTGGTGGVRFDRFVFERFFGRDRITDFEAGPGEGDKIDLSALKLIRTDVQIEAAQNGFSSRLVVGPFGGTILLEGVTFDQVDFLSDLIL